MKIGIIGAMDMEIEFLKESMENLKATNIAKMTFYEGKIAGVDVALMRSGVGKVNAALAAEILINNAKVTHIINTGCAGALDKDLSIGDIVISKDAVEHDMDASIIGFKKGDIPYMNVRFFPADEELIKKAEAAVNNVLPDVVLKIGSVCSGDQFISSKAKKEELIKEFNGLCAEMEGAAIAHACYLNDIPYCILRSISDQADEKGQMSFEEFAPIASRKSADITKYMIENWE